MDNELGQGGETRRRVSEKSRRSNNNNNNNNGAGPTVAPCGACKFLRRKCLSGCIFAPHFGSDQGSVRFAAVHKVFGASNVSKLLTCIPAHKRHDAAVTVSYEAQARLSDPVYGCVSTIIALQQQVASLQVELSMVQTQLVNSRFVTANALNNQNSIIDHQQQEQALQQIAFLQPPAYSNAPCLDLNAISNNNHQDSNFDTSSFVETALQASNNGFERSNYLHPLRSSALENEDGNEDEAEVIYALNH